MKSIPGFPEYQITKHGQVWSKSNCFHNGKWLKSNSSGKYGHQQVSLYKNEKLYQKYIHRLVLETYVGVCPKGMECRHLDGNPKNNQFENLCWGTKFENQQDAIKHGTHYNFVGIGEQNPYSKLTGEQVRLIFNTYHDGAYTQQELADCFGVDRSNIGYIVRQKSWKHIWK